MLTGPQAAATHFAVAVGRPCIFAANYVARSAIGKEGQGSPH